MPTESAVAELAPAPTQQETPTTAAAAATKHFRAAMNAQTAPPEKKPDTGEPVIDLAKPDKSAADKSAKTVDKPKLADTSVIPEELLTGKKPEPAAAEHDDILDAEPPANLSQKGQASWRLMRERSKTIALERDSLKKDLAEARAAGAPKAEIEAIQTDLKTARERAAELEAVVERSAFEQSPRFQQFVTREKAALDSAKGYLEGSEVNPHVIDTAAGAKGAARLKILREAGMEPELIAAIAPTLDRVDDIRQSKAEALAGSKALSEQWTAQEKRATEERESAQRAEEDRVFDKVGAEFASRLAPYIKVDGHDGWNAQGDKLKAEAKEFYNGSLPLPRVAEIAYAGVAYRVVDEMNATLRAKVAAQAERLAKYEAAQPGAGAGAAGDNGTHPATTGTAIERATAAFSKEMGR